MLTKLFLVFVRKIRQRFKELLRNHRDRESRLKNGTTYHGGIIDGSYTFDQRFLSFFMMVKYDKKSTRSLKTQIPQTKQSKK